MNLGDLIHGISMKTIMEEIQKLPPDKIEKMKIRGTAIAACQDLFTEIIECPTTEKLKLSAYDFSILTVEVIAAVSAILVYRYAKRTDKPEEFCNVFKGTFQGTYDNLGKLQ